MAWTLVANIAVTGDTDGAMTGNIDTSGADLIVLGVASYVGNSAPTISDSKTNTWTALTKQSTGSGGSIQLYYVQAPTVGTGHNFTTSGAGSYSGVVVAAFSGSQASPFDVEQGATTGSVTSIAPGSITPTTTTTLMLCGVQTNLNTDFGSAATIDSSFVITDRVSSVPALSYAFGLAYKIKTDANAENPTWSWTSTYEATCRIAAFKAAAGGARGLFRTPPVTGLGIGGSFFRDPLQQVHA